MTSPLKIQAADPLFSLPLGEESTKWTHWSTPDKVWERLHTMSQFAVLEGEDLEVSSRAKVSRKTPSDIHSKSIKRQIFEALNSGSVEMSGNGEVALHGQTLSAWTTAIPGISLKEI